MVQKSFFFSPLADETQDVSKKEQLTIIIRYLNEENAIKEDFTGFIDVSQNTTG